MFPFYKKKKKSTSAPKKRKKSKPDLVKRLDKVFALYIRLRLYAERYGTMYQLWKNKAVQRA